MYRESGGRHTKEGIGKKNLIIKHWEKRRKFTTAPKITKKYSIIVQDKGM